MVYRGVGEGAERGLKKGDKRWKRVIKRGAEGLKRTVIVLEKVKEEGTEEEKMDMEGTTEEEKDKEGSEEKMKREEEGTKEKVKEGTAEKERRKRRL